MQITPPRLNQFSIWLVEIKQTYIKWFSARLNPRDKQPPTKNIHSPFILHFCTKGILSKTSKTLEPPSLFLHLDSIWKWFAASNILCTAFIMVCFQRNPSMAARVMVVSKHYWAKVLQASIIINHCAHLFLLTTTQRPLHPHFFKNK